MYSAAAGSECSQAAPSPDRICSHQLHGESPAGRTRALPHGVRATGPRHRAGTGALGHCKWGPRPGSAAPPPARPPVCCRIGGGGREVVPGLGEGAAQGPAPFLSACEGWRCSSGRRCGSSEGEWGEKAARRRDPRSRPITCAAPACVASPGRGGAGTPARRKQTRRAGGEGAAPPAHLRPRRPPPPQRQRRRRRQAAPTPAAGPGEVAERPGGGRAPPAGPYGMSADPAARFPVGPRLRLGAVRGTYRGQRTVSPHRLYPHGLVRCCPAGGRGRGGAARGWRRTAAATAVWPRAGLSDGMRAGQWEQPCAPRLAAALLPGLSGAGKSSHLPSEVRRCCTGEAVRNEREGGDVTGGKGGRRTGGFACSGQEALRRCAVLTDDRVAAENTVTQVTRQRCRCRVTLPSSGKADL